MSKKKRVALFDLDHTLIPIDSDYEWGEFTISLGWCDATEFKRRNAEFFDQYRAGTLDIHDYVRFATQAIREQGATKSIAAHTRFMSCVVQKAITPQALELVQRHRYARRTVQTHSIPGAFRTIARDVAVQQFYVHDGGLHGRPRGGSRLGDFGTQQFTHTTRHEINQFHH